MFCPRCGVTNTDGSRFCRACGAPLPPKDRVVPTEEALPSRPLDEIAPSRFDEQDYLPSSPVAQPATQQWVSAGGNAPAPQPPKKTSKKSRTIAICAATVLVVALVGVGAWFLFFRETIPQGAVRVSNGAYYSPTKEDDIAVDPKTGLAYADNELIVYARPGVTRQQVEKIMQKYDAVLVGYSEASNSYQFRLPRKLTYEELLEIARELKALEEINDAIINPVIQVPKSTDPGGGGSRLVTPAPPVEPQPLPANPAPDQKSDPYLTWGTDAIHTKEAWESLGAAKTQGGAGSGVSVGIIDDQFYADHQDLRGLFADMNPSYAEGFSAWYNSAGYYQSEEWKQSEDYDESVEVPSEHDGQHGTHVAGIIAARESPQGSVGVATGATLYGWQDGLGTADRAADGTQKSTKGRLGFYGWATAMDYLVGDCGCKVVNVSASFKEPSEVSEKAREQYREAMTTSLRALLNNGREFVVCVSAGNNAGADAYYNSKFTLVDDPVVKSRIIVVGSLSRNDDGSYCVSDYSSGGDRVDILAPGGQILSTTYKVDAANKSAQDDYCYMWGTSMAAPMVSGVAALAFKANPDLSGAQVKQLICESDATGQAYAGTGVNNTPARKVVNAKQVVERAPTLVGEAGKDAQKPVEPTKPEPAESSSSEAEPVKPEPATPAVEVGATNFDLSSDGEYVYFFNARDGEWTSKSSRPQIVRMPISDESKQEVIWTSPTAGGFGMFALGEGKIVYGVTAYGEKSTIDVYSMNVDGSDARPIAPMTGLELHGALRSCIADGRVYYLAFQKTGVVSETMQLRSCALDGSDDRLVCEEQHRPVQCSYNCILGVVDGQVVFTRSLSTNAGTHPHVVYTAPADGSAEAPTVIVNDSAIQPILSGNRVVVMQGSTVRSVSLAGTDPDDIATLDGVEDSVTLFGGSPSYAYVYCSGTKENGFNHRFYRVDIKTKQVHDMDTRMAGELTYNLVDNNVYMTTYGSVIKYDADLNKIAELIQNY